NVRESDIALAQESVRQAELSVQQAKLDLDNTTLVAPFDGVVAAVNGNPGETAPAGSATSAPGTAGPTTSTGGFITLLDPRAVRPVGQEQTVEVVGPGGETVTRLINTGVRNDQQVEITQGLAEGEQISIPTTLTRVPTISGPGPGVQVGR